MKIHELIVEAPQPWLPTPKARVRPAAQPSTAPVAKKALPVTPAAPPAAKVAAPAPAAKEPIVQATDDMERRMLDRMGKRFGLPPGSSAEDVQAAQQDYLDKNDPAAAAQYKKNMSNIDAGGAHADNAPVKLAPTTVAKAAANPDDVGAMSAAKAGKSPVAIMLAQPSIAGNQQYLDAMASVLKLPAGSSVEDILAADNKMNAAAGNKYAPKESVVDEGPASRKLCTSGKPDSALGASNLASCKSQGYRSRDGGKSHKVGRERVKVQGKKIKGKKYGGPLPDWS